MPLPTPRDDTTEAWALRVTHQGRGYCLACGFPWLVVGQHVTPYANLVQGRGDSCAPLCQPCFDRLTIPERLELYMALVDSWEADSGIDFTLNRTAIREAVERGD